MKIGHHLYHIIHIIEKTLPPTSVFCFKNMQHIKLGFSRTNSVLQSAFKFTYYQS